MDYFLRSVVKADLYWQRLTDRIYNYKIKETVYLDKIPKNADLICFHGIPRILNAESVWVKNYVNTTFKPVLSKSKVTVIIPYKVDRGWLKDAVNSVPDGIQLLVSQGEGNWPANFNKVLDQATGDYIKYLHEDDMLTENCIEDSVMTLEESGADFIHGQAIEITGNKQFNWKSPIPVPTINDLVKKNVIHSATLMYRREVFEKIGSFDEKLNTAEEYEFNMRCLHNGLKIVYCDSPLAYYRRHPAQKVRTINKVLRSREREQVRDLYR
jgi:hypothetical protein